MWCCWHHLEPQQPPPAPPHTTTTTQLTLPIDNVPRVGKGGTDTKDCTDASCDTQHRLRHASPCQVARHEGAKAEDSKVESRQSPGTPSNLYVTPARRKVKVSFKRKNTQVVPADGSHVQFVTNRHGSQQPSCGTSWWTGATRSSLAPARPPSPPWAVAALQGQGTSCMPLQSECTPGSPRVCSTAQSRGRLQQALV